MVSLSEYSERAQSFRQHLDELKERL